MWSILNNNLNDYLPAFSYFFILTSMFFFGKHALPNLTFLIGNFCLKKENHVVHLSIIARNMTRFTGPHIEDFLIWGPVKGLTSGNSGAEWSIFWGLIRRPDNSESEEWFLRVASNLFVSDKVLFAAKVTALKAQHTQLNVILNPCNAFRKKMYRINSYSVNPYPIRW